MLLLFCVVAVVILFEILLTASTPDVVSSSYPPSRLSSIALASQLVQSLHIVTMFRSSSVAQALNHIEGRLRLAQVIGNLQLIKETIRDANLAAAAKAKSSNPTTTLTTLTTTTMPPLVQNSVRVASLRQYHEHWCFLTAHDALKILFATLLAYLEADDIGGSAFYKALCVPELVALLFRLFNDPTMLSYAFSLLVRMMQVDFGMLPLEFTDNPNAMDDVRKNVIPIRTPIKQGMNRLLYCIILLLLLLYDCIVLFFLLLFLLLYLTL
jgi:hypothetical protein